MGASHIQTDTFSLPCSVGFICWSKTQDIFRLCDSGTLQLVWPREVSACMYVTLSCWEPPLSVGSRTCWLAGPGLLHVCLGELEQLAEGVRITAGIRFREGSPPGGYRLRTVPPCTRRGLAQCTHSYHGLLWNAKTANDHDKHMCLCVLRRPRHCSRH